MKPLSASLLRLPQTLATTHVATLTVTTSQTHVTIQGSEQSAVESLTVEGTVY